MLKEWIREALLEEQRLRVGRQRGACSWDQEKARCRSEIQKKEQWPVGPCNRCQRMSWSAVSKVGSKMALGFVRDFLAILKRLSKEFRRFLWV